MYANTRQKDIWLPYIDGNLGNQNANTVKLWYLKLSKNRRRRKRTYWLATFYKPNNRNVSFTS